MATRKILYKHIAQTASTYIGRGGELILDTVNKTIRLADGSTAGGTTVVPFFYEKNLKHL